MLGGTVVYAILLFLGDDHHSRYADSLDLPSQEGDRHADGAGADAGSCHPHVHDGRRVQRRAGRGHRRGLRHSAARVPRGDGDPDARRRPSRWAFSMGDRMYPRYSAFLVLGTTALVFVVTTIVSYLPTRTDCDAASRPRRCEAGSHDSLPHYGARARSDAKPFSSRHGDRRRHADGLPPDLLDGHQLEHERCLRCLQHRTLETGLDGGCQRGRAGLERAGGEQASHRCWNSAAAVSRAALDAADSIRRGCSTFRTTRG